MTEKKKKGTQRERESTGKRYGRKGNSKAFLIAVHRSGERGVGGGTREGGGD